MSTRLPYSYFFWVGLNLIFLTAVIVYNNFLYAVILEIIFSTLTYITICRYACRMILYNDRVVLKYCFPLVSKEEIVFSESDFIRYELGYYYYFNTEHSLSKIQFLHPHDTIFFYKSKDEKSHYRTINVNTNYFDFKRFRKEFEPKLHLVKSYE